LRRIEIGGRALRSSGNAGGGDRLTRVAHLLHWGAGTPAEADESHQKVKRTGHDSERH
jgi:hypothetical protein